ncbi:hypothetical protein niasHT_032508 [Heterodera trifolii]|uniref:Uncharacterized protein n=1 Tax=Heterodera trifolii TaxID=157864 RepID=A0ABD2IQF1_9BILA
MMGSNEEVSSSVENHQNHPASGINFCPNPSQPLRQTRGTCSQRKNQQQWTARSVVGIYTDEEDEEEEDDDDNVEEDDEDADDDDDIADDVDVSTEEQQTDVEQYKETVDSDEKIAPLIECEQLKNFLSVPPTTKCQSNSDAILSSTATTTTPATAQNGGTIELVVVTKQKQPPQHNQPKPNKQSGGAESRANSAENGTRKNLSAADQHHYHNNHHHLRHNHHHRHHKSAGAQNRVGRPPAGNKWSTVRPKRTYGSNGNSLGSTDVGNGNGAHLNGHLTAPKNEQQQNANDECETAQQKTDDGTEITAESNNGNESANKPADGNGMENPAPPQGTPQKDANDDEGDHDDQHGFGADQKQGVNHDDGGGGSNAKMAIVGGRASAIGGVADRARRLSF